MALQKKLLCRVDDIPEGGAIGLDDDRLVGVCHDGRVHIYRNLCPHQGTPLNWLPDAFFDPDGRLLQCHTHDACFLPETGECISGPCVGESLRRIEYTVEDGAVYIEPEEPQPAS